MLGWVIFCILLVIFFIATTGAAFFAIVTVLEQSLNVAAAKTRAGVKRHRKNISALNRVRLAYGHAGNSHNRVRGHH